jgi:hypothetical protein
MAAASAGNDKKRGAADVNPSNPAVKKYVNTAFSFRTPIVLIDGPFAVRRLRSGVEKLVGT